VRGTMEALQREKETLNALAAGETSADMIRFAKYRDLIAILGKHIRCQASGVVAWL
jgi:hypothetical protein